MRAAAQIISVCALVLSLGLHWALLQTVAWTGMVVQYSQQASLKEAVAKTFDGQHPCCLCKAIQKGRAEERQREQQRMNPTLKLEFALVWQATAFQFACGHEPVLSPTQRALARSEAPLTPPPRLPGNQGAV